MTTAHKRIQPVGADGPDHRRCTPAGRAVRLRHSPARGIRTRVAPGGEGLEILTREVVDCVILDLEMPGLDGFDVLRAMEHRSIDVPVIVYTGTGSFDRCVEAVRLGAFSFIDKAEPMERVVHEVRLALRQTDLRQRLGELEGEVTGSSPLIGESEAMIELRGAIDRVADIPARS